MKIEDLFNLEDPRCLYCNGPELNFSSETFPGIAIKAIYNVCDTYTCKWCEEEFQVIKVSTPLGLSEIVTGFGFSCDDVYISYHFDDDQMQIIMAGIPGHVKLPPFIPDTSDKQKLYLKLKTYITFS
jgi:hypothetical protein